MKSPLFLSPKAGSLWPLNTCLNVVAASPWGHLGDPRRPWPGGPTPGSGSPKQTRGFMGSAVEWWERGWGAWSPSQGCPRCSVPALSPLSPTRGNHSPQAAPAGATAVCGHDRSPCHRMSPTHSCASVSLSASDTQGHLPPSWGQ